MSRNHSYLNSAQAILSQYKGEEPFASFVKKFFSQHKKFGSKDRKLISHLCYCFFRLGKSLPGISIEEKILTGLFLCSAEPNEMLEELKIDWNKSVRLTTPEKISMPGISISPIEIFCWQNELSGAIEDNEFIYSHFYQPDLFLRIRPGKQNLVTQNLNAAAIPFEIISDTCLALPNSSKINEVIELDKDAVVQDFSSQRIAEFIPLAKNHCQFTVWDCCAASGGKSILVKDILADIDLTVSDVRESILANLKKRFAVAGIKKYNTIVTDLTNPIKDVDEESFHLILADVPCSGSGTWGRTPERLSFFKSKEIEEYSKLQKKIISNVLPKLMMGGHLIYSTCSVFKKENEDVIDFIKEKYQLDVIKMKLIKGYNNKADTMFAALLHKRR